MNHTKLIALFLGVLVATFLPVCAEGSVSKNNNVSSDPISSHLASWWNGNGALSNWFGLGKPMKDDGLTIEGKAKEVFLGQVTPAAYGPRDNGSRKYAIPVDNWNTEVRLYFIYDFGKVFGLNGLSVESDWRYRNVNGNPNCPYTTQAAGATGVFNPSKDTSGMGVRIMSQFVQWKSDITDDPDFLLKAGWINPYEDFLRQPESKNFENNAIATSKGIGAACYGYTSLGNSHNLYTVTAVPWSSSFDSWGGMLRAKPSSSTYLQTYLGLAIAGYAGVQATDNNAASYNNHGFNFQGTAAFNPNDAIQKDRYAYGQNGIYSVNELGWTPKFGAAKLDGHYAIGNYIWGQNNNDFGSHSGNSSIWGLYLQADQRLTAVKRASTAAPSLGKNPVSAVATYDKTRGLYSFSEFSYTPAANNTLPFYFQTGLVYKGLFDVRPNDKTGVALGEGFYSQNLNSQISSIAGKASANAQAYGVGKGNGAKYGYGSQNFSTTAVLEYFYDIAINKWLDIVPDAQYIINPSGNGSTVNAAILGVTIAAKF
jgi:porin